LSTAGECLELGVAVRRTDTVAATTNPARTLWASCGGTLLVTFDGSAVQMVMPALRRDLHAGIASAQWAMTAFLLVTTAAYLPAGRLGDDVGRARVWRAGLWLFVAASIACMLATSLAWLIAARVVQALGAAAITANSAPLLLAAFPAARRAHALALGSVAIGLGLLVGPAVGALLAAAATWRLLFAVAVPLGLAVAAVARHGLPDDRRAAPRSLDAGGALLSAAGLGALVVGLASGRQWGWLSPKTLALGLGGFFALVFFASRELERHEPLVELRLFARRSFSTGALSALLSYASLFTATATMPFYLVELQHRSLVGAGLFVAAVPIALALAAPASGRVADRVGSRWPCTLGLVAVAAGMFLGALLPADAGALRILVPLALAGAGLGAYEPSNSAASLSALGAGDFGIGSATLGVARNLGMTAGAALAGTLLGASAGGDVAAATAGERAAHAANAVSLAAVHSLLAVAAALATAAAITAALRPSGTWLARAGRPSPSPAELQTR
jgi:EmrB/QacA subfamily drug resistance transporter